MTPSTSTYRPAIDGLRALAVVSVMIFHAVPTLLPGGFVGVDVFFVISGYVVTRSLALSDSASARRFIGEFYARRLARILPGLVLVLMVAATLATLFIPQAWLSAHSDSTARAALFGLSNISLQTTIGGYFAERSEFNPYTHTWSLGVEEQFYLLAPWLVFLWLSARRQTGGAAATRMAVVFVVVSLASLLLCAWASRTHPTAAFYFIGCRFWELSCGALLHLGSARLAASEARLGRIALQALPGLGVAALLIGLVWADPAAFPWPWALAPVLGTLLLIHSDRPQRPSVIHRLLSARLPVWIGLRSYALYLWHWPVYVLMRWTLGLQTAWQIATALLITVVLAVLSYACIEKPWRHHPRLEKLATGPRVGLLLLLPVVALLLLELLFGQRASISLARASRESADWQATMQMADHTLGRRVCAVDVGASPEAGGELRSFKARDCQHTPSARQVFVVGDSHAAAISPMFELYSAETGSTVRMHWAGGCGFIDFRRPVAEARDPGCATLARTAIDDVLAHAKSGDILVLPSLRLDRYGDQSGGARVLDMQVQMYGPAALPQRQRALPDAQAWLAPLVERGLTVIFIAPTPVFKAPPFRCVDWFNRSNPDCAAGLSMPRGEIDGLRQPILDDMARLAGQYRTLRIWDPLPQLCDDQRCEALRAGRPVFSDGDHLSSHGNALLYPSFKAALQGAG